MRPQLSRVLLVCDFTIERITVKSPEEVAPAVIARAAGPRACGFFCSTRRLRPQYAPLAAAVHGRDLLIVQCHRTETTALRRDVCAARIRSVFPSPARQLMDALAQFIVSRKWRDPLMILEGPLQSRSVSAAFARSAQKFGARVVASPESQAGHRSARAGTERPGAAQRHRPRFRRRLCCGRGFRFCPHGSLPSREGPRPVVGGVDLEPVAWHWTWDHNGAPQVNTRFEKKSGGRHMQGADWAAWLAVRMIVQSALRTGTADFASAARLHSWRWRFDGDKGLAH